MKLLPLLALIFVAGCAKEKSNVTTVTATSTVTYTAAAVALSSNNQCEMMNCHGVKTDSSASATSTDTTVQLPPSQKPALPRPLSGVKEDAQAAAQHVNLQCQNGECDPSVGFLSVVINNDGFWTPGQCTASLIGPDLLVTNAHCIPHDLEESGSSCADRMWITFADDAAHPDYDKMVGCSKMLFRHRDTGMDGADYAYLQLQHAVNRPFLHVSQAGFENNKTYHVHKINPIVDPTRLSGEMQKVDCRSMYDSAVFEERLDAQAQTSFFVDCEILHGNSGSPILDDQGNARGVIYAFIDKRLMTSILDHNGSRLPKIDEIADINVGSNFACLPPALSDKIPAACGDPAARLAARKAQSDARVLKEIKPALDTILASKEKGHADVLSFGWTFDLSSSEALGIVAHGRPECLAAPALAGKSGKLHRPFFYVKADFDKYLTMSNPAPVWAGFSPTAESVQVGKANAGKFPVKIATLATGQTEFGAPIPACR